MLKDSTFQLWNSRCLSTKSHTPLPGLKLLLRRAVAVASIGILAFLTSCASPSQPVTSAPHLVYQKVELNADIAADLVSTLPQLLEPLSTTLQFNNTESGAVKPVVTRLVELGYGMQKVDSDQGNYFLRLDDLSTVEDVSNRITKLRLAVGDFEFTRSYRVVKQNVLLEDQGDFVWRAGVAVVPASPLTVSGTRAKLKLSGMQLTNPKDLDSLELTPSSIVYGKGTPIQGGIPTIALVTDDVVKRVAESASGGPNYKNLYADSFKLNSMTHIDDNAFSSISDDYNRITRQIIVFPNDSDFLGKQGKVLVKKVIERFSKSSDIVGIIGCSTGRTKLAIGNEGLALGRATRVAEELFTAGIARDKVFNEGCWSTESNERGLPNRGVAVDLWRRKS